jgi:fatty acid/phospholipid biosynthesis enzyme
MIETLERILEQMEEGNIGFAEAGDWLHGNVDVIISELEELEAYRKGEK